MTSTLEKTKLPNEVSHRLRQSRRRHYMRAGREWAMHTAAWGEIERVVCLGRENERTPGNLVALIDEFSLYDVFDEPGEERCDVDDPAKWPDVLAFVGGAKQVYHDACSQVRDECDAPF